MSDSVPALVLDDSVTGANAEPVHFGGFPGLWLEGTPIAVSELGFAEDVDVYALVEELGLPLAQTKVAAGEGLMPEVANHVRAGEVPVFEGDELVEVVEEELPTDPFVEAVAAKADDLIPALAQIDDLAQIDGMLAAEQAGKARSTVVAALEERRAALAPAEEVTA